MNLIDHCESFLGEIVYGCSDGTTWPFQVVKFLGGPIAGTATYMTLGLSDIPLQLPACSPEHSVQVRLELLFMARSSFGDRNIPGILHQVGTEAISRKQAYLAGEVIGPRGVLIAGTCLEALYVSVPVCLPNSFAACEFSPGESCFFAWLIPISHKEAHFVVDEGWEAFEDKLVAIDPDLLNLERSSIV